MYSTVCDVPINEIAKCLDFNFPEYQHQENPTILSDDAYPNLCEDR